MYAQRLQEKAARGKGTALLTTSSQFAKPHCCTVECSVSPFLLAALDYFLYNMVHLYI